MSAREVEREEEDDDLEDITSMDFNCSTELYEFICERETTAKLTLREFILKQIYEREVSFRIKESALLQKIEDLQEKLALSTIDRMKENENIQIVHSNKFHSATTLISKRNDEKDQVGVVVKHEKLRTRMLNV
jgi:hypothetical protein